MSPPTITLMRLPPLPLTLLTTIPHGSTPGTPLRIPLAAHLTRHLAINLPLVLPGRLDPPRLEPEQLPADRGRALGVGADGVDVYDDERFDEVEEGAGGFQTVGCGGRAREAGGGEGVHAFVVVLGCDEGEDVDEGGGEGGGGLLGGAGLAEEEGDRLRVGEVGCGGGVVDAEAEEGRGGGGGGGHGGCCGGGVRVCGGLRTL